MTDGHPTPIPPATARIPFFSLERQHHQLRSQLQAAFDRVCNNGWFILGQEVKKFEQRFATYLGAQHCVGTANGTDALEMALEVAGIGQSEEVIVPANTWVSVAEAVVRRNALPVFADALTGEFTLDPSSVERCITNKTRAVIVVHQYGQPARMKELQEICLNHRLILIEDCAHAHGAEYHGQKVGCLGDLGCFSFYPTKNLSCLGDGGVVVTQSAAYAGKLRTIGNHGQSERNNHVLIGRNSRLDELQAAFLTEKLDFLERWSERRRQIAVRYRLALSAKFEPPRVLEGTVPVYHQYVLQCGTKRDRLKEYLRAHGIGTAIHYPLPIADMPPYSAFRRDPAGTEKARQQSREQLSIPVFPELLDGEIDRIIELLLKF